MNTLNRILSTSLVSLGLASTASALDYSNLYVFGDSLSDTGNLQTFSQDPQVPSRFTNGPVAVEVLAAQLGLSISNALHLTGAQHGNNFAVAGAIAIDEDGDETTPDINLPTQVNSYLAFNGYQAEPGALYVVMIGGNDIRAARTIATSGEDGARKAAKDRVRVATRSIKAQLKKLLDSGAQHLLVVNAPDIGAIPETDLVAMQLLATAETKRDQRIAGKLEHITSKLTAKYNTRLANMVSRLEEHRDMDIMEFDLSEFVTDTIENAESYGISNSEDACIYVFSQGGAFNPECNLDTFLFFDEIHPTTAVHQRAGATLYQNLLEQGEEY
jgi:phospholipase/lecithinase/hemolysin